LLQGLERTHDGRGDPTERADRHPQQLGRRVQHQQGAWRVRACSSRPSSPAQATQAAHALPPSVFTRRSSTSPTNTFTLSTPAFGRSTRTTSSPSPRRLLAATAMAVSRSPCPPLHCFCHQRPTVGPPSALRARPQPHGVGPTLCRHCALRAFGRRAYVLLGLCLLHPQ
jgi:hypothetical protein